MANKYTPIETPTTHGTSGYNPNFTHEVLRTDYKEQKVVNILQTLRRELYEQPELKRILNENWKEFREKQEEILNNRGFQRNTSGYYLQYFRKITSFDLPSNIGMVRSRSEKKLGGATSKQCEYVVGGYDERSKHGNNNGEYNGKLSATEWKIKNFVEDDKKKCWLCSKPLWVNEYVATPQSEHKSPCYLMALTATGLAYTCKRKMINSAQKNENDNEDKRIYWSEEIPEFVYEGQEDALQQLRTWKLLVRGEGMAWSHAYCNNFKSQTPFISLIKIDGKYLYIIEYSNIKEYIERLWDKDKSEGEYMPTSVINLKKTADKGNVGVFFKPEEKVIAEANIIKRLIPLVCLLNQGSDIQDDMYKYCSDLLGGRTISKLLRGVKESVEDRKKLSIENRIYQNCKRISTVNGCSPGSNVRKIADETNEYQRSELINQLLENLFGSNLETIEEIDEKKEEEEAQKDESKDKKRSLNYSINTYDKEGDDYACEMISEINKKTQMEECMECLKRTGKWCLRICPKKGTDEYQKLTHRGRPVTGNNNTRKKRSKSKTKRKLNTGKFNTGKPKMHGGGRRRKRKKKRKITKRKKKRKRTKKKRRRKKKITRKRKYK